MNPLLPPSAEASGVFALLEVIADPKKAKAQLDVLAQKQAELARETQNLQTVRAELQAMKTDLEKVSDELARRSGSIAQREAQLAHDAQEVRAKGDAWRAADAQREVAAKDLDEKRQQVLQHENALAARENAVQRLEVETKNRAARLSEDEARLNDRLTKLRALAG